VRCSSWRQTACCKHGMKALPGLTFEAGARSLQLYVMWMSLQLNLPMSRQVASSCVIRACARARRRSHILVWQNIVSWCCRMSWRQWKGSWPQPSQCQSSSETNGNGVDPSQARSRRLRVVFAANSNVSSCTACFDQKYQQAPCVTINIKQFQSDCMHERSASV
jgi:hypothetical protein